MAGSASDYVEALFLNSLLGGVGFFTPGSVYLAAYTAAPTDAGGGTEVSGGSYARVQITNNTTNFPNAVSGEKNLGVAQLFPEATGSWGTVTHFGILDAGTGGNLLFWGELTTPQAITTGDILRFPAGSGGLRVICD